MITSIRGSIKVIKLLVSILEADSLYILESVQEVSFD